MDTAGLTPALLYPIDAKGIGTSLVQSFTSFVCSVAVAHKKSPAAMLRVVSGRFGYELGSHVPVGECDAATLNSYGSMQRIAVGSFSRAYQRADLVQTSLGQLAPVFASLGGRAVKSKRHWCPGCYAHMRSSEEEAHDLLMWQVADLMICPVCKQQLRSKCPKCRAEQPSLPPSGAVDCCFKCGGWLGDSVTPKATPMSARSAAYQEWLTIAVARLLECRSEIADYLTGKEPASFLRSLANARGVNLTALAKQTRVPLETIHQWTRGRCQPTLTSWLRACANMGVNPADTLIDPAEAAKQLVLPFDPPRVYLVTRDGPRKKHSRELIEKALKTQLQLKRPSITSVKALAREISVPISMIYFHAPKLAKALAAKYRQMSSAKVSDRKMSLKRSAQRILKKRDDRDLPLTRKPFVEELMRRNRCGQRTAKDLFPIAMARYRESQRSSSGRALRR